MDTVIVHQDVTNNRNEHIRTTAKSTLHSGVNPVLHSGLFVLFMVIQEFRIHSWHVCLV